MQLIPIAVRNQFSGILCLILSGRPVHLGRLDTYVSCALVAVNFLFTIPYLVVAAYGTRSTWEAFHYFFLISLRFILEFRES